MERDLVENQENQEPKTAEVVMVGPKSHLRHKYFVCGYKGPLEMAEGKRTRLVVKY